MKPLRNAGLLIIVVSLLARAQRPGGEIRRRVDANGLEYFEVFADAVSGEHGAPAPMRLTNGLPRWPKSVFIRAESTWKTSKTDSLDADGKGAGTCSGCRAPSLPWGALIARWAKLETTRRPDLFTSSLPVEPLSAWLLIGKSAAIDVPMEKVNPKPYTPAWLSLYRGLDPGPEVHYTPLIMLQFQCNDANFSDNDGWLHVYQEWVW